MFNQFYSIMKNSLFLLGAAAVVALSSCTKNEVLEEAENRAIGFDAFVGKCTRVTEDVTLTNLGSFQMFGWRGESPIFATEEGTPGVDVTVTPEGVCTYSPLQYWEANYTYAFEAIAPKNGEKGVSITPAKEGGAISFTSNGTTDLIYAKPADVTMIESAPNAVTLNFQHLLSRVKFTFKNAFPENAAAKITVTDVKITNANTTATITPGSDNSGNWTGHDASAAISFPGTRANVAAQASASTEHMYLIPITAPSYNLYFKVTLTQATGISSDYEHNVTIKTNLEKNNSYNFTAELKPENIDPDTQLYPITFSAKVGDWSDFTTPDITPSEPSIP